MVNAYKKVQKDIKRQEREDIQRQLKEASLVEHYTNFTDSPYDRMACGNWIAADDGICTWNSTTGITDVRACYHPILPVERLKNIQTGEEQIKIAFKRNNRWQEIIVPKDVVATASKIVGLSKNGIAVTSETAKHLVRYLSDVENLNDEYIEIQYSSGKLGWIGDGFLPYSEEIIFDGDAKFRQLFEAIQVKGDSAIGTVESAFSFGPWKVPTPTGSKTIGFKATFPRVPTVPYLAKGAVIPPRSEFLAVLGDQKQGNNIETPEALLRKIVREETAGRQAGGGSYRFTAQINRRTLFDEMMKEAQMRRDTSGKNPFEMA